jgi:Leu/Phe-tRNA-protein transferase
MTITHWIPKENERINRKKNGTFKKKKISTGLKLLLADIITIGVMAVMISHAFIPKATDTSITSYNAPQVAVVTAKEEVIQQQIDILNNQLNNEHKKQLDLQ